MLSTELIHMALDPNQKAKPMNATIPRPGKNPPRIPASGASGSIKVMNRHARQAPVATNVPVIDAIPNPRPDFRPADSNAGAASNRPAGPGVKALRLIVIAGNTLLGERLAEALAIDGGITVSGCFETGEQVLDHAPWPNTDVVLLDLDMPGSSSFQIITELKRLRPDLPVAAWSAHTHLGGVIRTIRAGATGYFLKEASLRELATSLIAVAAGGVVVSPSLIPILFDAIRQGPNTMLAKHKCAVLRMLSEDPRPQAEHLPAS